MIDSEKQLNTNVADVSENDLRERYPEVLEVLLRDHTTGKNIFWATDNYAKMGEGFNYHDEIMPACITGKYGKIIRPRVQKDKELQSARVRDMAEVFTPSWICNAQINLVDNAWFGYDWAFNEEINTPDGRHTWKVNSSPVKFPEGKTWWDYVKATRLEITCGEAPYITSRYDTTTGEFIPVERRIGMLDRKLRVISENIHVSGEWLEAAQEAYRNIYAFEWQGDSLLLAREAMLYTFIENYKLKFGKAPQKKSIKYIAYIVSWNIWQMDGLKFVIPDSCHESEIKYQQQEFFESDEQRLETEPCPGCVTGDHTKHNGIYCLVKDWWAKDPKTKKQGRKIEFRTLFGKGVLR